MLVEVGLQAKIANITVTYAHAGKPNQTISPQSLELRSLGLYITDWRVSYLLDSNNRSIATHLQLPECASGISGKLCLGDNTAPSTSYLFTPNNVAIFHP